MLFDRRRHKRFRAKSGGKGLLMPGWPRSTIAGDILDISAGGGLALRYLAQETISNRPYKLTIACTNPYFRLDNLPIRAVWEIKASVVLAGSMVPRRLGLQFGELSRSQTYMLKDFIRNHAVARGT